MKIILPVALVLIFCHFTSQAQDIIYKEDGQEIKTRVLETGKRSIVYKDFNDPDFTTQFLPVSQVSKIRYEDGTERLFNNDLLRHFFGLTLGSASANGDFGSTNTHNENSGYAENGPQLQIDFGFYVKKHWAINFNIGGSSHSLDMDRMNDPYRGLPDFTMGSNEDGKPVEFKSNYFLLGPLYSLKLGKKFLWDFKLLTGALLLRRTSFHMKGGGPGDSFYNSYEPAKGATLGLVAGTAIRFNIFKWMSLRLSLDMVRGKPQLIGDVESTTDNGGIVHTIREENLFYQKFRTTNLGLGLVFMFNR